jgi:peptidyl-prolyl cis-trans isomerase C
MSDSAALHNYFMLRGALVRHQQLPWQLSEEEQAALKLSASREEQLVARALASPAANDVRVDDVALQKAYENFVSNLASQGKAEQLLSKAGLQRRSLTAALDSEIRAAAVLERLVAAAAPTEQEVYHWYATHPEKFLMPEQREVFQILITVNELYAENRCEAARKRIDEIALKANAAPDSFGELALGHSECPSAVEAGRLGVVPPGHLYPELDRELFFLESGAISRVIESPLGFHLLRCGVIEPSRQLAWDEVRESLTRRLTEINRKRILQQWLTSNESPVTGSVDLARLE